MKKVLATIILVFTIIATANIGMVYASNAGTVVSNTVDTLSSTKSELKQIKEKSTNEVNDYIERYGSEAYGITAYVLDKIRIYSIPICFIGIAVGAIYQYVIGIRKLDVRDRGFGVVIAFVTMLIICQVLPLVFAIVVKGWRG